jgi:hypothetical protein
MAGDKARLRDERKPPVSPKARKGKKHEKSYPTTIVPEPHYPP